MHGKVVDNTFDHIQLFRERLSEKCARGNQWDMINTLFLTLEL